MTVTVRDTGKVGEILAKVIGAGSNQITGPTFSVSEPEKYLNEARKKAVENALAKANAYASAANLKLGPVLEMVEPGASAPIFHSGAARALSAPVAMAPVPIEAGEDTLQAQIVLIVEVKP